MTCGRMGRVGVAMVVWAAALPAWAAEEVPVDDSRFVFATADKLDGFLLTWLEEHAPHLVPHHTVILHWSAYYAINPRITLALMELDSGLVTAPTPEALARPFGDRSPRSGMSEQLQDVLEPMFEAFHARGGGPVGATAALSGVVGPRADGFDVVFARLFPDVPPLDVGTGVARGAGLPPADLLGLPYLEGEDWAPNGTHTWTGSGASPLSSIDYSDGWPAWGADTSDKFVAAAHEGTVVIYSSCYLEVVGPDGWSTAYYHLDGILVSGGQSVSRDEPLAIYANNQAQALCNGGSSTGPHVHVGLLKNGSYFDMHDVMLSRFRVDAGRFNYDSDCNEYFLERNGLKACAYNPLLNDGGKLPEVAITEFLNDPLGSDTTDEWVELTNVGTTAVDLSGFTLADEDSDLTSLPSRTLAPGASMILASSASDFVRTWGVGTVGVDVFDASLTLANGADELVLVSNWLDDVWSLAWGDDDTPGESTHLAVDPPLTVRSHGDKAAPGVVRDGEDAPGYLGYESQDATADAGAWVSSTGDRGSPLVFAGPVVPSLSVSGTCPGPVTLELTGLSPDGRFVGISAPSPGSTPIPGGSCAGVPTGLDGPTVRAVSQADASGNKTLDATANAGLCGLYVQIVDVDTCTPTNVAQLP